MLFTYTNRCLFAHFSKNDVVGGFIAAVWQVEESKKEKEEDVEKKPNLIYPLGRFNGIGCDTVVCCYIVNRIFNV